MPRPDHEPGRLRERLRAFAQANGLSIRGWAKAAGIGTALSNFLNGHSDDLTTATVHALATAAHVDMVTLLENDSAPKTRHIKVIGRLERDGLVATADGSAHAPETDLVSVRPGIDLDRTEIVLIEDFSMPPLEPGWRVLVDRRAYEPDRVLGQLCLVETADGERLFRKVMRGYQTARYNLASPFWSPRTDVEVVGCRPVLGFLPPETVPPQP